MQRYNCLIVEDEPLVDAALQKEKIDLVFLDIHLPKLKGLDFIKTLKNPPRIIITSAYHEYALQGYEYNVVDYLLKPIEFSRFLMAVNKLTQVPVPEHALT